MLQSYKNNVVERAVVTMNLFTATIVASTFVALYGFDEPLLSVLFLHNVQIAALMIFLFEKTLRFVNSSSKKQYVNSNWFEIPLLIGLFLAILGAGRWYAVENAANAKMLWLAIYLVLQVVVKACRGCVSLASSGRNPTKSLISIFMVMIIVGAGLLMLPKSYEGLPTNYVDALFTATSAACVTGLVVRDTGADFSLMGQIVILTLIQLGGLGIVIFGAVIALLLGQALSVRESVAMQDLLNAETLGKIGNIIGFIIVTTFLIEAVGALGLYTMWESAPEVTQVHDDRLFYSIFHSVSAFCNAGFGLFGDSLIQFNTSFGVYGVIAPLIIVGGLGFGVLYNLMNVACDRVKRFLKRNKPQGDMFAEVAIPKTLKLQTKIVLAMTVLLILAGTLGLMVLGDNPSASPVENFGNALFQSITARTAGFNTIDIAETSSANKLLLMVLMFIGGSPGSTAGGIKTVTLAVVLLTIYSTMHKRKSVEVFKRSIGAGIVERAVTVIMLFAAILLFATFALVLTEKGQGFDLSDIMFETASALGTVGLSTGITGSLTTGGKLVIIATMLVGRLGPLTLLAAMTFNVKPVAYDYPTEPIVVG